MPRYNTRAHSKRKCMKSWFETETQAMSVASAYFAACRNALVAKQPEHKADVVFFQHTPAEHHSMRSRPFERSPRRRKTSLYVDATTAKTTSIPPTLMIDPTPPKHTSTFRGVRDELAQCTDAGFEVCKSYAEVMQMRDETEEARPILEQLARGFRLDAYGFAHALVITQRVFDAGPVRESCALMCVIACFLISHKLLEDISCENAQVTRIFNLPPTKDWLNNYEVCVLDRLLRSTRHRSALFVSLEACQRATVDVLESAYRLTRPRGEFVAVTIECCPSAALVGASLMQRGRWNIVDVAYPEKRSPLGALDVDALVSLQSEKNSSTHRVVRTITLEDGLEDGLEEGLAASTSYADVIKWDVTLVDEGRLCSGLACKQSFCGERGIALW
jgi:hypothetical protein